VYEYVTSALYHVSLGAKDMTQRGRTRRQLLAALGTAHLTALTGCLGGDDTDETVETTREDSSSRDDRVDKKAETGQSGTSVSLKQQATLSSSDGDSGDRFGYSVAVSGDGSTVLVGAKNDESPNGVGAGSAYVFGAVGSGRREQAKLVPSDGDDGDSFGHSVAVSADGTTAVVGAFFDQNTNGLRAGSAYVFSQDGTWQQQAKLVPEDGDSGDRFGYSVAVSGDGSTVLVGAHRDGNPNGDDAGSAYVFSRTTGTWRQQAKLAADDGHPNDDFGYSVAVSADGTTAIVGARRDEAPNGSRAGSAYIFSRKGDGWQQQAELVPRNGNNNDQFGVSVALSADGSTTIVGAPRDTVSDGRQGSASVFSQTGGTWQKQAKLTPNDEGGGNSGRSVSLTADGTTATVGAWRHRDPNGSGAVGSAHVFSQSGGAWRQQTTLTPNDGDAGDRFGWSVAVSPDGSTTVVGAFLSENSNGSSAGSVYVFE